MTTRHRLAASNQRPRRWSADLAPRPSPAVDWASIDPLVPMGYAATPTVLGRPAPPVFVERNRRDGVRRHRPPLVPGGAAERPAPRHRPSGRGLA